MVSTVDIIQFEDTTFNNSITSLKTISYTEILPTTHVLPKKQQIPSSSIISLSSIHQKHIKNPFKSLQRKKKPKKNKDHQPSKRALYLYYTVISFFTLLDIWAIIAVGLALNTTIYYHNEVNIIPTITSAPFSTKKYFLGNDTRNIYGDWYGYLILSHVICGILLFSSLNIPLFTTMFGSYNHMLFGSISVLLLFAQLFVGLIPTTLMFYERGFTPCSYSQYSFPVLLYIHFIYWLLWMSESVCYAIAAVVYRQKRFQKPVKYILIAMSIVSISGAIFRVLYICTLVFIYGGIWNIECVLGTDVIINGVLFTIELLTVVFSIKNIKYGLNRSGKYSSIQWRMCHNRNMTLVSFLVFWTMMANIAHKTMPALAIVAYIIGSVGLFVYSRNVKKARENRGSKLRLSNYARIVQSVDTFVG